MEINMSDKQSLHDITNATRELQSILDNLKFEDLTDDVKAIQKQAILDSLEGLGLEQKLEAYCQVIAEKKANNDYLSAEIARLQKRKKSNNTVREWLRGNIQAALIAVDKQKVDTGLHKISITKRTSLEIDYDALAEQGIPEVIYKPAVIDETATKKAIQDLGIEIDGVQEVEKTSIRIT
jgi:aminopeptidase N